MADISVQVSSAGLTAYGAGTWSSQSFGGDQSASIAIGSVELVERTNPRTQTTFQYVVEFQPANQPNPRL